MQSTLTIRHLDDPLKIRRPISQFDAQIAAIARQHGARIATRHVDDFEGCGIPVVNPWG